MLLRLGIIFRGRKITYNDEVKKVYKAVDIDVGGWGRDDNNVYSFSPLKRKLDMYVLSSDNRNIVGKEFDDYKFYAGVVDTDEFFEKYYYNNSEYNYEEVKKQILNRWEGYYTLGYDMTLNRITNINFLKIIEDVFKDIKDDWFITKPTNKTAEKSKLELSKYGSFLTDKEYINNPAIGRDKEIETLEISLLTPDKSGIIVGEAGVGKTAIVEGLAYKIKNGLVPEKIKNLEIISINTSSLISGCQYVGMVEDRVNKVVNELRNNKQIIMFIDEIHTVIGAGAGSKSNLDVANILKPHLDRGDIKIIGSTTLEEYNNLISDPAFKRRFKKINVFEPENDTILEIIDGVIDGLEKYYNIKFSFNDKIRNDVFNILIEVTSKQYREQFDKTNNPDLILSILKETFAIASLYDKKEVTIEEIIKALNGCDRIYESVRERYILELEKMNLSNLKSEDKNIKVLKFPNGKLD